MNKVRWILLFTGILLLGILSSQLSVIPVMAVLAVIIAAVILFMDYEKATLIVALYTVFEYVLRQVIQHELLSSVWDELALLACFGIWFYKWLRYRKENPFRSTPLDISLVFFMVVGLILLFTAAPDFAIGLEGLRVVIQYMFWFFVITQLLKTPQGAKRILNILVLTGFLVSLYGIYQYIIAVDIPDAWVDMNEGYVRTRVFSIFTRPNMLAGYLCLLIPVAVGLFFNEKNHLRKVYIGSAIAAMGLSTLFTMSRQGWLTCIFTLIVFVWFKNKKLLLPSIVGLAALLVFCMFFVPSVSSRILYLLSPAYIQSSMSGGRIIRAIQGFELFSQNFWTGMGLGQFGGSVALSHKLNHTFSMDNYYLKTAVEMGIFGLVAFLVLMYSTIAWCSRALSRIRDAAQKDWARGIVAGLAGVMVYNLTENMLEIPLISTYFWMLAGIVMFLAYGQTNTERVENNEIDDSQVEPVPEVQS